MTPAIRPVVPPTAIVAAELIRELAEARAQVSEMTRERDGYRLLASAALAHCARLTSSVDGLMRALNAIKPKRPHR